MRNGWAIVVVPFVVMGIVAAVWAWRMFADGRQLRRRMRAATPGMPPGDEPPNHLSNVYADWLINKRVREYRRSVGIDPEAGE